MSGDSSDGSSNSYGGYSQYGPYGQRQRQYATGAPVEQPTSHLVEVRAGLKYSAAQVGATVICLVIGGAAVGTAIQNPDVEGRGFAIVVGGIFVLIGLGLAAMLRRVLRTRRYSFTAGGLEGENYSGRTFTLPWSAVQSIEIQAYYRRSLWRLFSRRQIRNRTTAYLRMVAQPGADLGGEIAPMSSKQQVTIPFWNSPELIDSMAYGCRTFAGEKLRGVVML